MIYCDASLLVAPLVDEAHSADALRWLQLQAVDQLAISDWTITEVGSALAMKQRRGDISTARHEQAIARAEQLMHGLNVYPVERHQFSAAGRRHVFAGASGLRAGDALHLAIVVDHGLSFATLDIQFADGARQSGVLVEPVLST